MTVVYFFNKTLKIAIDNVAFTIGDFKIYWYGIIIALGFLVAIVYAYLRAKEFNINFDKFVDVIIVGVIGSILGARTYYVVMSPGSINTFWDFFNIHEGGIAIYGAVIGAFLFGGITCIIKKINILDCFDLTSIGFLIGQAIGRWGNFMNQEAFGCNTSLPWGMWSGKTYEYLASVKEALAESGIEVYPNLPVHPCFLYESIWCLIGFVLIHILSKKRTFSGENLLMYLMWYGLGRFFIEGLRTDSLMVFGFRASQVLAAICFIVGLVLYVIFKIKSKNKIDSPKNDEVINNG